MKWSPLSLAFVVVLLVGGGVLAGRAWFPRIVVQPITREVATLVPGKTIVVHDKVPGPITFVDRTVTRTVDHIVFVSTPTTLTPEQLAEAERVALRKFTLDLRIPAGQLIPCAHPHLAQSGMSCAEDVAFQARILEPAAGIFVPVTVPGSIAVPVQVTVEARLEATATPSRQSSLAIWPVSLGTWPSATLSAQLAYRNQASWGGTYEIRVGYHYLGQTPGLDVTALWGIVL